MMAKPPTGKERRDIIIVTAITLFLPLFSMYIHLSERLYDFSTNYELLGVTEYLINFCFLYLSGLLYLTYRRWLKAEKKRKELENIIDSINPDVLIVVDQRRKIIVCNNTMQRMFGYNVDEAVQQTTDFLYFDRRSYHEDNKREIYEILEKEGFHIGLATGKKKSGETFPLEIITGSLSGEQGAVLLLRDITIRKEAEDALLKARNELEMRVRERTEELTLQSMTLSDEIVERKRKEEELQIERKKFQILTENAPFGMALIEADGTFKYVNAGFINLFGYDCKACCSWQSWLELTTSDNPADSDSGFSWTDIQQEISLSGKIARMMRITRKEGEEKMVLCSIVPLEADKYLMSCEDISDRKIAEDSLRESEERYRTVIENSNDGIAIVRDEIFTFVNRKFSEMFGYESPQEIEGKPALSVVHPDDATKVHQVSLLCQLDEKNVARYEFRGLKKNREQIFLEASETKIIYFGLPVTLSYIRDITERKLLESQLLHAQKMEAIGQLAGGVAHDFNNILTALIGYGDLLLLKMNADSPLKTYVNQILNASQSAAKLTQSLLAFSRKQVIELKPCEIGTVIKGAEQLLSRLLSEDIALTIDIDDGGATVMADKMQIEQIFINLATNARDAMPNGGALHIVSQLIDIDSEFINEHAYGKQGRYVLLIVSDTGCGIDAEIRDKIFDPFFTTKDVGKGTGLGLSIVYGIVKQHDGYINVKSKTGEGTSFHIYLPAIKMDVCETQPLTREMVGGTETILIAEDNDDVRAFARDILKEFGYKIIEAGDGQEAISMFQKWKDTIDLMIVDVVMPKKNGKEVYTEVKSMSPDMKLLFMSGYTGDVVFNKGVLDTERNFIAKPFAPGDLIVKVREMLDG